MSIENENDLFIKKYRQDSFIGNNRLYVNTHNIYLLGIKGHEESLAFLRLVNYESYSENSELIKQSLIKNNKISNHEGEKY